MSTIDKGGSAFPVYDHHGNGQQFLAAEGMTLRDYFAAKAMHGLLTDLPKSMYGLDWMRNVVVASYELADAMLRARGNA